MDIKTEVKELQEKLVAKQDVLARVFAEAGPDMDLSKVKSLEGDNTHKVEQIRALNAELSDLRKALDSKQELLGIAANVAQGKGEMFASRQTKSIGEMFVESAAYKDKGAVAHLDVDLKTLFSRGAGWAPEVTRSDLVVDYATRPIQVTSLVPTIPVDQSAYKYMEETTFTNAAAEAAEDGAYGEAALALTERTAVVEKVGVWIPVTDEQLEDVAGAAAYIDRRLRFMLQQRFDSQILNGNGTTPNLQGILNVTGIQTQAKGTLTTPDAIHKAMTKVRTVGMAFPDAVVLNPADWEEIRLLSTTDGVYLWGGPAMAGPEMIWGVRVVQANALAAGTGLVGDFANFSLCGLRRGIEVQISNAHDDFFIKGKQAVRADFRAVLVWLRPTAFCTVTGI